ncbi:hypothetical protein ABWH97_00025 [Nitratireductor sp. ac15]
MSEYPKTGRWFTVEKVVHETYRWHPYKPQGAKQMGKPGRWQKMVWHGDFFKWENCEEPEGKFIGERP